MLELNQDSALLLAFALQLYLTTMKWKLCFSNQIFNTQFLNCNSLQFLFLGQVVLIIRSERGRVMVSFFWFSKKPRATFTPFTFSQFKSLRDYILYLCWLVSAVLKSSPFLGIIQLPTPDVAQCTLPCKRLNVRLPLGPGAPACWHSERSNLRYILPAV